MIRLNNDYNQSAHPAILKALSEGWEDSYCGYGLDELCALAAEDIHKLIDCPEAQIHFLVGGTQMNYVAIQSMLRPYQAVIAADTGHIEVHESGSIENTGHKIHTIPSTDGKITAEQIRENAAYYLENELSEHMTQPHAVYLSYPTEFGTLYSLKELEEISAVCREYDMFLFIDGARMAYGLTAPECDLTLADITRLADAYYIGGTKCGALFGEAFVTTSPEIRKNFRNYMKMNGALLAKGWLLGLQFHTLLEGGTDSLYFTANAKANIQAKRIQAALAEVGIPEFIRSQTNQIFAIMTKKMIEDIRKEFEIEYEWNVDESHDMIRICTAWSSRDEEIDRLIEIIKQ